MVQKPMIISVLLFLLAAYGGYWVYLRFLNGRAA